MKIEIAESMVYSWLRKVRNCRLVQTNWKPAHEWPLFHVEDFARKELNYDIDFYSMTDAGLVEEKVKELLSMPSYRKYSKESNDSRKCGLERYAEFVAESL